MKMLRRFGVACAAACAAAFVLAAAPAGRRIHAAIAAALVVIFLPGLAAAADAAAAVASTVIDFGPVVSQFVVPLVIALLGILGTWLLAKAKTWLNLKNNDALAGVLETAMQNGLALAQSRIPNLVPSSIPLDVKNEIVAVAGRYVLDHVPDALKLLGVDQTALVEKLEARLSVNTTPPAASIAVPTDPAAVRSQ